MTVSLHVIAQLVWNTCATIPTLSLRITEYGYRCVFVGAQPQTVPTLKQMRQAGTFETRAAHNKSHHRCGCRPGSSGLSSAREAARRGAQRDRSEGPENRGPDPRR